MSLPPPDNWRPPQPPPGPLQGPPFGLPPSAPQQPPGPPNRGNGLKWVLGALVLLVVVAVSVGATLLFTRGGSGDNPPTATSVSPTASGAASDVASANDRGPVNIITQDPTCAAWGPIVDTLSAEESNGWTKRDPSVPATSWTPEQRAQHETVGRALIVAADRAVTLSKLTPHRVMRQLYEQFIAYSRAYAARVPNYSPGDDHLAGVSNSTSSVITWICASISYGSASARAPLVPPPAPPLQTSPPGSPKDLQQFLASPNPVCRDWTSAISQFNSDIAAWRATDPNIPAAQWTPQQRDLAASVTPVMRKYADTIQALGRRSDNPTLRDFADLSAQYRRAYIQSLLSYTPADNYLAHTATDSTFIVLSACQAAGA